MKASPSRGKLSNLWQNSPSPCGQISQLVSIVDNEEDCYVIVTVTSSEATLLSQSRGETPSMDIFILKVGR